MTPNLDWVQSVCYSATWLVLKQFAVCASLSAVNPSLTSSIHPTGNCGTQVRSHAQKHFIRLEKKGLGDVVPPARRKARWADKRSAGMCDNFSESDQDFSALHQQTSSSSVSTREHQAMLAAGQSLEGQFRQQEDCGQ